MDLVFLNRGQVTRTTPELAPQRDDVSALDRFNVHCCPTRRVFSGTGLEDICEEKVKCAECLRYMAESRTRRAFPSWLKQSALAQLAHVLRSSWRKAPRGHNVTVNGDRYRAIITNFFIPQLNNHDVQELWFQQDGATCHTASATIDLLKDTFGDRLISRFGPVNWSPRSCDLTPLDYFLWGYVKSLVYADKPQTLEHLEDNIRRVIADIRPQMLEKVIENWTSRLDYIRASRGSPMPEIIFKI
ncbi:putative transposable element [Trichonephila clavipes]|nr:putative transposable element [Trichonephila clavipes]